MRHENMMAADVDHAFGHGDLRLVILDILTPQREFSRL